MFFLLIIETGGHIVFFFNFKTITLISKYFLFSKICTTKQKKYFFSSYLCLFIYPFFLWLLAIKKNNGLTLLLRDVKQSEWLTEHKWCPVVIEWLADKNCYKRFNWMSSFFLLIIETGGHIVFFFNFKTITLISKYFLFSKICTTNQKKYFFSSYLCLFIYPFFCDCWPLRRTMV